MWFIKSHKCEFTQPVYHGNKGYWMKCPKCDKVRDSYLPDFKTNKIEKWKKQ